MSDVKPNPIIDAIAGSSCYLWSGGELCNAFFRYHLDPKINKLKRNVQGVEDEFHKVEDKFQKLRDEFQKIRDVFKKIEDKLDPKKRLEEISSIRFHEARNFQVLSFPRGRGF